MEIKKAEFTLSAPRESMCPKDTKPEYAFIGRSNVGKSSLINMLTNNKKLAKTSATPGKTLLINHFIINNEWYLVDLPGYGFAKRSKKEIQRLEQMINGYILQREQLVNVFLLVDVRLEPQKVDLDFIQWLGASSVPFAIVFTKADKLSVGKVSQNVEAYKKVLSETWEELPPQRTTGLKRLKKKSLSPEVRCKNKRMAKETPYLDVQQLTKSFGSLVLFENISFSIAEGQKVGLIAKNGTGKSTLLSVLSGKEGYDSGEIIFRRDLRVGMLEQSPVFDPSESVLDACFNHEGDPEKVLKAKQILTQLKIKDLQQPMGQLSGGQQKRVALANVLITDPDLLILDEPTNHLDLEMIEWLEGFLSRGNKTLLMVTHDRFFLDRVCSVILELDDQRDCTSQQPVSY